MAKRAAKKLVALLIVTVFMLTAVVTLASCGNGELQAIEITTEPTKTAYIQGETFDPAGMVVTAKYEGDKTKELKADEYTYSPSGKLTTSDRYITITYTESEVEQTVRQKITVTNDIVEATVSKNPTKTEYISGQIFDPTGMELSVKYQDNSTGKFVVSSASDVSFGQDPLTTGQTSVEVTVGTVKVSVPVTVNAGMYAEAENGLIDSANAKINTDSPEATGGAYVGDMKSGESLTFLFSAESEGTADITFRLASQYLKEDSDWTPIWMGDCQLNLIMDVLVNGEPLTIGDDVILPGGGESGGEPDQSLWFNWQDVDLGQINLVEGLNTVTITFKQHSYTDTSQSSFSGKFTANVDSMWIVSDGGVELSPVEMNIDVAASDVSLIEEEGVPYLVVDADIDYSGYTAEALEANLAEALGFALQNVETDAYFLTGASDYELTVSVANENEATAQLKADVSGLTGGNYAVCLGYDENEQRVLLNKDTLPASVKITGGSFSANAVSYEVVYSPDSTAAEDCEGNVGLKVTTAVTLDSATLGTQVSLEERDGRVWYVIAGGTVSYTKEDATLSDADAKAGAEKLLQAYFYFDLQNNPYMESGNWSGNWDANLVNAHVITITDDTFELAVDVTDLANNSYTTHCKEASANTGNDGWNDFKPDIDSFTSTVTLNGRVYAMSYTKGGGNEQYYGCVGMKISDAPAEPAA